MSTWTITPTHYILLGLGLFAGGLAMLVLRRRRPTALLGLGLMWSAAILVLLALAGWFQDGEGQVLALVVMTLSVLEGLMGLSVISRSKN